MTDFPTLFIYLNLSNPYPFIYMKPEILFENHNLYEKVISIKVIIIIFIKVPLSAEPPLIGHYREYPPGTLLTNHEATVPPQRKNEGCSYWYEQFNLLLLGDIFETRENIRTGVFMTARVIMDVAGIMTQCPHGRRTCPVVHI